MYREFFNIFLAVERRRHVERPPEEPCPRLRRIMELSIPGPPGMADHAMQVLALGGIRSVRRKDDRRD